MTPVSVQLLITADDPSADRAMQRILEPYYIQASFCPPEGMAVLDALTAEPFDAVLLRTRTTDVSPAALPMQYRLCCETDRRLLQRPQPLFFALLPLPDADRIALLRAAGYSGVLAMPVSEYLLAQTILRALGNRRQLYADERDALRHRCRALLWRLGLSAHLRGVDYLCECLVYLADDPQALHQLTKVLYPAVAQRTDTSATNVERSMRTAVAHLVRFGNHLLLAQILPAGYDIRRLCTSELLAALLTELWYQKDA